MNVNQWDMNTCNSTWGESLDIPWYALNDINFNDDRMTSENCRHCQLSQAMGTLLHMHRQCVLGSVSSYELKRACMGLRVIHWQSNCLTMVSYVLDIPLFFTLHEMHGRMHPSQGLATILLASDPISSLAYTMITHTSLVASNLPSYKECGW